MMGSGESQVKGCFKARKWAGSRSGAKLRVALRLGEAKTKLPQTKKPLQTLPKQALTPRASRVAVPPSCVSSLGFRVLVFTG